MFAGASYIDVALLFGVAKETVFHIMREVDDAINNMPSVGPFFFPQTEEWRSAPGKRRSGRWVRMRW